jgi:hypothetical protein
MKFLLEDGKYTRTLKQILRRLDASDARRRLSCARLEAARQTVGSFARHPQTNYVGFDICVRECGAVAQAQPILVIEIDAKMRVPIGAANGPRE